MSFDYQAWQPYLAILGALALAMPVAWNRESNDDIVGMRTFPLVAVGACAYMLLGLYFIGGVAPDAKARLLQGLMTGIGFVGGGAILKHDDSVSGTASAASIWIMGAIGAATALDAWGYAVALSVVNFLILWYFVKLKQRQGDRHQKDDPGT